MPFDGTSLSQEKRDLIAARELLIERGWVPHPGETAGPMCVGMALYRGVCDRDPARTDAAYAVLFRLLGVRSDGGLFRWNDAQASIEPVLALLDEAITAA